MARRHQGRMWRWLSLAAVVLVAAGAIQTAPGDGDGDDKDDGSFGFTPPIACKAIRGYEDYEPLPNASITADEKLFIYFKPRHFKSTQKGGKYEVHFTQEGRIRPRGVKTAVAKLKAMEFRNTYNRLPQYVYLMNTISLKGLKPGEYDFDVILSDAVGKSTPVTRTVRFTVVEPAATEPPAEKKGEPGGP